VLLDLLLSVFQTLRGFDAYLILFVALFACGIGGPVSQDVLLLATGAFSLQGVVQPVPAMLVAWLALLAGDALTFWTGHYYGARWVRRPWAHGLVPPERLPGLEQGALRWGAPLSFVTRFLPGQRTTIFFILGTLRLPYRTFFLWDGLAALIHVPLLVLGARTLGWSWQRWRDPLDSADNWLTLAVVLVLLVAWLRRRRAV
jgi:membrane protein DedA with SNARE-associated domain